MQRNNSQFIVADIKVEKENLTVATPKREIKASISGAVKKDTPATP
jgi:hypothetical protein